MRVLGSVAAAAAILGACLAAAAVPEPIDLSTLDEITSSPAAAGDVPLHDVAVGTVGSGQRFYVTGILGDTFATLADPVYGSGSGRSLNGSILTAGGAAGVAYARDNGQWRLELEGRGRDDLTGSEIQGLPPVLLFEGQWAAADGWSALANVWRDWWIGEQWGVYLGGGLGGGGYRYGFDGALTLLGTPVANLAGNAQVAGLAWQAGGGMVYELSERVTFDVGYRFFSIARSDVTYFLTSSILPPLSDSAGQQFTAGEVLFSLRVYEPFRRWR
ncbi:MAG: hypothetical protein ACKO4T_01550 [Planctomycetaceae bacterium]